MRWIRVRIEKGDYGEQGTYTLENEKWIFKDDRQLGRRPCARSRCAIARTIAT